MLLHLGRHRDALAGEDVDDPVGGPRALRRVMDAGERLQRRPCSSSDAAPAMRGNGLFIVVGSARGVAAEIVPVAAHRERGRADAAAEVEGKDLRTRIAPELECHQRQQHGLAGAGRADDQRVADVADMKGKPERGRALRLAEQQGGCIEVLVPFRPRPDRRERDHVGEIEGGNRRLAHIGVSLARQRSKPRFDRIDAFGDAGEIAALDDLLDQPELLGRHAGVLVPHRHAWR